MQITNIIPRRLRMRGGSDDVSYAPAAQACLERMMEIAVAAPQSFPECELARMLSKKLPDFEDALIVAAAQAAKADFIVTQDKVFLAQVPEVCITPARAVGLLSL